MIDAGIWQANLVTENERKEEKSSVTETGSKYVESIRNLSSKSFYTIWWYKGSNYFEYYLKLEIRKNLDRCWKVCVFKFLKALKKFRKFFFTHKSLNF